MKRRNIILLVVAAIVLVGGYFVWSLFRQAMWSHVLIHASASVRALETTAIDGAEETALEWVLVDDASSGMATIHLLGGTGAVDDAFRERFARPNPAHPYPSPVRMNYGGYRTPRGIVTADDEHGRTIELVRQGHGWRVDLRPLEVQGVSVEEAQAMRAAMIDFAERVRAGEFASFDEAVAAYDAAGPWHGFATP
jgi:hypothetical protein